MAGNVRTYDPSAIAVTVNGVPIGGFADGTFVSVSRSEDTFSMSVGADGDTTRVKSTDRSGECVITLGMASPSNTVLQEIARLDEISNDGVVALSITDLNSASEYVSAFAWIRKPADIEFGKESGTREWTFDLSDVNMFTGGYIASV